MKADESFEHLFRRYRRDGILLHYPYPPHTARRTNSKFGGLPTLPAHLDWPRAADGTPLHHFAQIDCADIPVPSRLPARGVLFFFARDDAERDWRHTGPADSCRVLYSADSGTTPREAPDDLPPVGGYNWPGEALREFLHGDEDGPNVHVEWPIQPLPIDTWPDDLHQMPGESDPRSISFIEYGLHLLGRPPKRPTWQEAEARSRRYKDRRNQLRAEAFAKATGERREFYDNASRGWRAGRAIFSHAEHGPEAYPQHWIAIHYAVRALLHRPAIVGSGAAAVPAAEEWLRRSNEIGLEEVVSEEDRGAFRTWLTSLDRSYDESPLGSGAGDLVFRSLLATIRAWAGDAARSARLAPHVYESMRFHFNTFPPWGPQYPRMLGHGPSNPLGGSSTCLLNLPTDRALGWTFGDADNATFWIEPDDLERRDFSKVQAMFVRV
jgi:hypothetical protein